jgi:hypothetical protein
MQAIMWTTMLLGFVLVTWAILAVYALHPVALRVFGTGKYDKCPRCIRAYESTAEASLTLLQTVVFGDGWGK